MTLIYPPYYYYNQEHIKVVQKWKAYLKRLFKIRH